MIAGGVSRIETISISDTSRTTTLTVSLARIPQEAIATNGAATRTGEFRIYFPKAPTAAVRSFQGETIDRVIFPATMAGAAYHHNLTVDITPGVVNLSTMDTQSAPKFPTELKSLPGFVFTPGPPLPSVDMISKIDALTWERQGGAPTPSAIILILLVQAMENLLQQSGQQVGVGAITSRQGQFTYLVGRNPALSLALSSFTIANLVPPSLEDEDQSTFRLQFSAASAIVASQKDKPRMNRASTFKYELSCVSYFRGPLLVLPPCISWSPVLTRGEDSDTFIA